MIKCFSLFGYWGHKMYYFWVQCGSSQKITGHYGVWVPKTLPRGLVWTVPLLDLHSVISCS